jgi:hypothetical protein
MSGFDRTSPATQAARLAQLEAALRDVGASLEYALKLEQAARNLLAALTPEGDVERLAAKKLAELLGPEVAEHG